MHSDNKYSRKCVLPTTQENDKRLSDKVMSLHVMWLYTGFLKNKKVVFIYFVYFSIKFRFWWAAKAFVQHLDNLKL